MPQGFSGDLREIVDLTEGRLRALSQHDASEARAPGAWSKVEILGHLIDSAANNHQRFVRVQAVDELEFPDYEQEFWVDCQDYRDCEWGHLVDLWVAYNRHLAHVLEVMPAADLEKPCRLGESPAISVEDLVGQYLAHLRHHVSQLSE